MQRFTFLVITIFLSYTSLAQVTLSADGPGNTYNLINSVLAPSFNVVETPDCGHIAFGEHIDEVFDSVLNSNVFRFILHTTPDDDRCINTDRQRCEIKTYDKSPANLLAFENETVEYKWKFKLPLGFQTSSNFTHLHQLKSVDDPFDSMPMYTLTARKGTPDKLELLYAEFGSSNKIAQIDLDDLLGNWVVVTENIKYANPGTYSIEIKKISDNSVLLNYTDSAVNNWRVGAQFIRPKWGVYRSLLNLQDLRDEEVLFNDFGINKIGLPLSIKNELTQRLEIFPNPAIKTLQLNNIPTEATNFEIFSISGQRILANTFTNSKNETIDISSLASGSYILKINTPSQSITRSFKVADR
jgi:hypothetical protein